MRSWSRALDVGKEILFFTEVNSPASSRGQTSWEDMLVAVGGASGAAISRWLTGTWSAPKANQLVAEDRPRAKLLQGIPGLHRLSLKSINPSSKFSSRFTFFSSPRDHQLELVVRNPDLSFITASARVYCINGPSTGTNIQYAALATCQTI